VVAHPHSEQSRETAPVTRSSLSASTSRGGRRQHPDRDCSAPIGATACVRSSLLLLAQSGRRGVHLSAAASRMGGAFTSSRAKQAPGEFWAAVEARFPRAMRGAGQCGQNARCRANLPKPPRNLSGKVTLIAVGHGNNVNGVYIIRLAHHRGVIVAKTASLQDRFPGTPSAPAGGHGEFGTSRPLQPQNYAVLATASCSGNLPLSRAGRAGTVSARPARSLSVVDGRAGGINLSRVAPRRATL
jgi:hypothetical protein